MADDTFHASTPQQFRALAHATRQRLLFELDRPATISQLAATIDTHKGNIAHHLKVLRDAGLVTISGTRKVRGGTEIYFRRSAERVSAVGVESRAAAPMLVPAVADEVAGAEPDPFLTVRHLRLTSDQADAIATTLAQIAASAEDAGADQPRYGMLLALYRQPAPAPPPTREP